MLHAPLSGARRSCYADRELLSFANSKTLDKKTVRFPYSNPKTSALSRLILGRSGSP